MTRKECFEIIVSNFNKYIVANQKTSRIIVIATTELVTILLNLERLLKIVV